MRRFLEALGLAPRVEAEAGGWVDLVTGGGRVALHDAASSTTGGLPGQTTLSFEVGDVDALRSSLVAAGFDDASVYDEAYARALAVTDPLGDRIIVDERADDLYGYRVLATTPNGRLRVVPVRFTDDAPGYARFLRALGLAGESDEHYAAFAAGGGDHGYVSIHYVYSDDLPLVPGPGSAHLTFFTDEPLSEVADRLEQAGVQLTLTKEDFGSFIDAVDPDGQSVQVHETPPG
jgi:hypothetical protein